MSNEKGINCNGAEIMPLSDFLTDEVAENNEAPILDNVIILNFKNEVKDVSIDIEAFKKGISSVSELCGAITALVNVGINPHKAMDYIVDKEASKEIFENNLAVAKIQADANISTLKSEIASMQKNIM